MSSGLVWGLFRLPPMAYPVEVEQPVRAVIISNRLPLILRGVGILGVIEQLNQEVTKIGVKKTGGLRIRKPLV